jgi:hypothetical protein
VVLHRVADGEAAIPPGPKNRGRRTKLGGLPDWIQHDETPRCKECKGRMFFVAQIDSIEHLALNNPFGFDRKTPLRKWIFSDTGMIYVFYCFECNRPECLLQNY